MPNGKVEEEAMFARVAHKARHSPSPRCLLRGMEGEEEMKKICERCGKEDEMLPWAHLCFRCAKEEAIEKTVADICSGEETSTFAEDDVICPWCGYRYSSDELSCADWPEFFEDGEHGMFCDECGKPFTLTVNVSYSYGTVRAEDEDL